MPVHIILCVCVSEFYSPMPVHIILCVCVCLVKLSSKWRPPTFCLSLEPVPHSLDPNISIIHDNCLTFRGCNLGDIKSHLPISSSTDLFLVWGGSLKFWTTIYRSMESRSQAYINGENKPNGRGRFQLCCLEVNYSSDDISFPQFLPFFSQ